MDEETDNVGTATILWTGRSQTVHAPLGRRWRVAEAHIAKQGDTVTLQPKGKNWAEYFESAEGASLPPSVQPPAGEAQVRHWGKMCTLMERVDLSAAVSKALFASPRANRWVTSERARSA